VTDRPDSRDAADAVDAGYPVPKRRLFLAIGLDDETKHVIGAHLREHLPAGVPGKLAPPDNWHLTLRFLGWTTGDQGDRILHDVARTVDGGPFTVRFAALGAFPKPRRATVLWLGIDQGDHELALVAGICEEAARDAGFAPEERPYHAHLTLSRLRPAADVTELIDRVPPCPMKMKVTAVQLYESHLGRGGARYEAVDTVEL
jgi:2'-5' RNA ligase